MRNYFATVRCFLELLYLVRDMEIDSNTVNRKNAKIMMSNIFHHDITRVLHAGFQYCVEGLMRDEVLQALAETVGIFFDLLEAYSKGQVLTLQTNRLMKKKKKNKNDKKHK